MAIAKKKKKKKKKKKEHVASTSVLTAYAETLNMLTYRILNQTLNTILAIFNNPDAE